MAQGASSAMPCGAADKDLRAARCVAHGFDAVGRSRDFHGIDGRAAPLPLHPVGLGLDARSDQPGIQESGSHAGTSTPTIRGPAFGEKACLQVWRSTSTS